MKQVRYIEWEDSQENQGWKAVDKIQEENLLCKTIGYIVKRTKKSIFVTHTITTWKNGKNDCLSTLEIPRRTIRKVKKL